MEKHGDLLRRGTSLISGGEAFLSNLAAVFAIVNVLRTSLGPNSMSKMLVDETGGILTTNDGATILRELKLEHPAAMMLREIAETQEKQIGDGTTTVVLLAGSMLEQAQRLLELGYSSTAIADGFSWACTKAVSTLEEFATTTSREQGDKFQEALLAIANSTLGTKYVGRWGPSMGHLAVSAVMRAHDMFSQGQTSSGTKYATGALILSQYLRVEKAIAPSGDSHILHGCTCSATWPLSYSALPPSEIEGGKSAGAFQAPRVALASFAMGTSASGFGKHAVHVRSADALKQLLNQSHEDENVDDLVRRIAETGAKILMNEKAISQRLVQRLLDEHDILAFGDVQSKEMDRVVMTLRAPIATCPEDLTVDAVCTAEFIRVTPAPPSPPKSGQVKLLISNGSSSLLTTVVLCGPTPELLSEMKRGLDDALLVLSSTLAHDGGRSVKTVPGGGASETHAKSSLRKLAEERSFLPCNPEAVRCYAEAFMAIPRALCANTPSDVLESLSELEFMHREDLKCSFGVSRTGTLKDMNTIGVVEPLALKTHAVRTATELCCSLLRVDTLVRDAPLQKVARPNLPFGAQKKK